MLRGCGGARSASTTGSHQPSCRPNRLVGASAALISWQMGRRHWKAGFANLFKMCFSVVYVFQSILILSGGGVRLSSPIYWQGNYIDYLHIFGTKMLLQRLDSDKILMLCGNLTVLRLFTDLL